MLTGKKYVMLDRLMDRSADAKISQESPKNFLHFLTFMFTLYTESPA